MLAAICLTITGRYGNQRISTSPRYAGEVMRSACLCVCLFVCLSIRSHISTTKFLRSSGVDKIAILTLQESYSLSALLYAAQANPQL